MLGFIAPVFAVSIVFAQDVGTGGTAPTSQNGTGPATTNVEPRPTTTTDSTSAAKNQQEQKQRIEKRKVELKTKLTNLQQTRIKQRCKPAQGLITGATAKLNLVEKNRSEKYTALLQKLNEAETKLAKEGVNTTDLKTQIAVLQTKVDTFKTDLTAYKQSITDTKEIDCTTDPVGFKASLESSRALLAKLKVDATEIRTHLTTKVKPAIVAAKSQLPKTVETN